MPSGTLAPQLRLFAVACAVLAGAWGSAAAQTPPGEKRIALVIGNSRYQIGPLNNPVNDVRAMAKVLRSLGFQTLSYEDVDLISMRRALADFGERMAEGGVALFYYSGHAVQVDGKNFLIPLGARLNSERYMAAETVELDAVLKEMDTARTHLNVVILDACRDNPFARGWRGYSRGLAQQGAPPGTFIAYATAPGDVAADGEPGTNGPYTKELLRALALPGLKIEDAFKWAARSVVERTGGKQRPWISTSYTGDFYFAGRATVSATPPTTIRTLRWDALAVPGPPEVNIFPLGPGTSPKLSVLLGVWDGLWDNVLASRLVVERIEGTEAQVVYAWGDDQGGRFKGGFARQRATILPGPKLVWGNDTVFEFEIKPGDDHLSGERREGRDTTRVRMRRVAP